MIPTIIRNKYIVLLVFISLYSQQARTQLVPLQYKENKSFTYDQTMDYYRQLDKKYKKAYLFEKGPTDVGKPLHVFIMYGGKNLQKDVLEKRQVPVLLVMNGIHPGEPDGIDASLIWAEWILSQHDSLIRNTCICIIPVYNIDGCLNRSCCSRANQDGPEQYGFRGNSKNLDLNRDFIKMDAANTESFVKIFHWLEPDMFIDTHVSNGADYQYTFTLLTTQKNKLEPGMGNFLYQSILPKAEKHMREKNWLISPYVSGFSEVPDSGLIAFYDSPRYSTGYAALFNVPGFVLETHMLKPFQQRVESTLEFLKFTSLYMNQHGADLKNQRLSSYHAMINSTYLGVNWKVDKTKKSWIEFMGYQSGFKPSMVTGKNRLYYDTNQPFTKKIPMYWDYVCTDSIEPPLCYIIPQGWDMIISRLESNGVYIFRFDKDIVIEVKGYKILSYTSSSTPYEGHHMKRNVKLEEFKIRKQFYKGDAYIQTGDKFDYFLANVLEPQAVDSYFAWGFFDSMLNQKEWFSDYVWEDKAYDLLQSNPDLKTEFENRKMQDTAFANNAWEQLYFIYRNSDYFEETYMEYPVYRYSERSSLTRSSFYFR